MKSNTLNNKGFGVIELFAVLAVVGIIGAGIWMTTQQEETDTGAEVSTATPTPEPTFSDNIDGLSEELENYNSSIESLDIGSDFESIDDLMAPEF